jgi:hypothetical protein
MMLTTDTIELSGSLQALVDSRLDTIDRMLMGRMPRQERLAIVREVEAQIFDLLQERAVEELTREDVLAVLARLDPPEAFLPEVTEAGETAPSRRPSGPRPVQPPRKGDRKIAKVSGILGLIVLTLILLSPVEWMIGDLFESSAFIITFWIATIFLVFVGGILSITMGIFSRIGSTWAVTGIVTSIFSLVIALLGALYLILELA